MPRQRPHDTHRLVPPCYLAGYKDGTTYAFTTFNRDGENILVTCHLPSQTVTRTPKFSDRTSVLCAVTDVRIHCPREEAGPEGTDVKQPTLVAPTTTPTPTPTPAPKSDELCVLINDNETELRERWKRHFTSVSYRSTDDYKRLTAPCGNCSTRMYFNSCGRIART